MKKKISLIMLTALFMFFPIIAQAIMVPSAGHTLNDAVIHTDDNGTPVSVEITGTFSDDCTEAMYNLVTEMENTLLIQVFLGSNSSYCNRDLRPFSYIVEIDSVLQNSSITVVLYDGIPGIDSFVEVIGDPLVIEGSDDNETKLEEIDINIMPETLNLKSKGKFVTVFIKPPEGYNNENMTLESAIIENEIHAEKMFFKDDIFVAKFNRNEIIELLYAMGLDFPAEVELSIDCEFFGDTAFTAGSKDTIKVLDKGKLKKRK